MITKMYTVSGMSCGGCVASVKTAIKSIPEVIEAQIGLKEPQAIISMREEIDTGKLQQAIAAAGSYSIREIADDQPADKEKNTSGKKLNKMLGIFHPKKDCCK
jgi:copper chaperone CopZ